VSAPQFTPGPWTSYEFGADWYVGHNHDDSGPMLRVGSNHAQREANANLIASAPDLYAAAERALNFIENTEGEHDVQLESGDMLRAALAKARGESA
jgi:hypothetical protein